MKQPSWHMHREGERLVLARRLPARFDFEATIQLPGHLRRARLAQQVRQDMWRALQNLRGFAPVVEIVHQAENTLVRAGGQVAGPISAAHHGRLQACLADLGNQMRWVSKSRRPR